MTQFAGTINWKTFNLVGWWYLQMMNQGPWGPREDPNAELNRRLDPFYKYDGSTNFPEWVTSWGGHSITNDRMTQLQILQTIYITRRNYNFTRPASSDSKFKSDPKYNRNASGKKVNVGGGK